MQGYSHENYAQSLKEFGLPIYMSNCDGWILGRQINGSSYVDAMGCYPLFSCGNWSKTTADFKELEKEYVSLSIVTDPFAKFDLLEMEEYFKDIFVPFKQHYFIDLEYPLEKIGNKKRRKHAKRAMLNLEIEVIENPIQHIEDWEMVYSHLIERHKIRGIRAFSHQSFMKQFEVPGTVMIRARYQGKTVSSHLYIVQDDVVHSHLGASTEQGYAMEAVYALDWFSFEYFKDKARWLNLGGGIGINSNGSDGLSQYKRLWATDTRLSYFCGRIFDHQKYQELVESKKIPSTEYFPAYRLGEFF